MDLETDSAAERAHGEFQALTLPCWLNLKPVEEIAKRRWVRIRYSTSFFDEPIRPLIRFNTALGRIVIQPMNGPVLGTAEWVGRVPDQTVSVAISPTRRLGRFSFRIDRIEPVSRAEALVGAWIRGGPRALAAIRTRLGPSRQDAWQALQFAMGGTPFEEYDQWYARLNRPLDLQGLDRPRTNWSNGPTFHLVMRLSAADGNTLHETLSSLAAQSYPNWRLYTAVGPSASPGLLAALSKARKKDSRLTPLSQDVLAIGNDIDWVAVIRSGDTLRDYALATMAERLATDAQLTILYSDEDAVGAHQKLHSPILKPDWSPIFHAQVPYLGNLLCIRVGHLRSERMAISQFLVDPEAALAPILQRSDRSSIGHMQRILYRRSAREIAAIDRKLPAIGRPPQVWPEVSVIIPTRDRADLLKNCTQSLMTITDYPNFNVIVVDNGSQRPDAVALLRALKRDPRFTVLRRFEPFNFSRLANEGSRATRAPVLAFLNNDIQILNANWLKVLVQWAVKPDVGAVGAKLLFPDGRIQHAGVTLGLGGIAGHLYLRRPDRGPGYMHQLNAVREVAAVTGACLVTERTKFEAVGGFDDRNFPVELNDMDLCLRLATRGLSTLWTPEAVLVHLQAATRGNHRKSFEVYRQERTVFSQIWKEAIRQDSYFHPALGLYTHEPALG